MSRIWVNIYEDKFDEFGTLWVLWASHWWFFPKKIKSVINPLLTPYEEALSTANAEIKQLKSQMYEKGTTIRALTKDIQDLQIKCDDIEQQGRKGSIRMFGVPESTPGTTGNKVLSILNDNVKWPPSLRLTTWRSPIEWADLHQVLQLRTRAQEKMQEKHLHTGRNKHGTYSSSLPIDVLRLSIWKPKDNNRWTWYCLCRLS